VRARYVDVLEEALEAVALLLALVVVGLAADGLDAAGEDLLHAFLQLLLLLVGEHEVEFLDFDEDVALVEVVDQSEVGAGEGDLEGEPHVLAGAVPLDARLEAGDGALLVEGVDLPLHLLVLLETVQPLDHLHHDHLLGAPLLAAQRGQLVCRKGTALLHHHYCVGCLRKGRTQRLLFLSTRHHPI
jgi:hypothetical protein